MSRSATGPATSASTVGTRWGVARAVIEAIARRGGSCVLLGWPKVSRDRRRNVQASMWQLAMETESEL